MQTIIDICMETFLAVGSSSHIIIRKFFFFSCATSCQTKKKEHTCLSFLSPLSVPRSGGVSSVCNQEEESFYNKPLKHTFLVLHPSMVVTQTCRWDVNLRGFATAHTQSLTSWCVSAPHVLNFEAYTCRTECKCQV